MRLFASLVVSCMLHAALVFIPYLGASSSVSRTALLGGRKLPPARVLDATLVLQKPSELTVAEVTDTGGNVTDSPAEPRAKEEPRPPLERAVGIGLLPIPAPTYYSTDQLTKRPQPMSAAELDTPEIRPILASGTIILKLWINELGDVIAADVEKTDLPEIFSAAAVAAFKRLRFIPGEINGRRVGTVMRIEITYDDGRRPPP